MEGIVMKKTKLRVLSGLLAFLMLFFDVTDMSMFALAANGNIDAGTTPVATASGNNNLPKNAYTVSFNAGDANAKGAMNAQTFQVGESKELAANAFTLEGKVFAGWDKNDDKVVDFLDREEVKDIIANPTEGNCTVSLNAVWADKGGVIFKTVNAVTGEVNTLSDKDAAAMGFKTGAKAPKKVAGYAIGGYFTDANLKTKKLSKVTADASKFTVIYVKVTPWTYTVKYNANGGKNELGKKFSVAKDETKKNYGVSGNAITFAQPVKAGYEFQGWATSKKGAVAYKPGQEIKDSSITKNKASIKLFAVWKATTNTVEFVYGDNESLVVSGNYTTGDKLNNAAVAALAKKSGVNDTAIKGWLRADKKGKLKKAAVTKKDTGLVVVYADYGCTLTVSFNGLDSAVSGTMSDYKVALTKLKKLPKNKFTKNGEKFVGWTVSSNTASANGLAGIRLFDDQEKFKQSDANVIVSFLADKTADGYTMTLIPLFAKEENIVFITDGSEVKNAPKTYTVGQSMKLNDAYGTAKAGYKFAGWYDLSTGKKVKITKKTTGTVYVEAKWKAVKKAYTITFDSASKNGVKGKMKDFKGTLGKAKAIKNKFKISGYEFLGWSTKNPATEVVSANDIVLKNGEKVCFDTITTSANTISGNAVSATVKLYANWAPIVNTVYVVDVTTGLSYARTWSVVDPIKSVADLDLPSYNGDFGTTAYTNAKCKKAFNFGKLKKNGQVIFVKSTNK